ncbi:MAG: helix-turn-helix domain-containing protein [Coleofasciculus sp. D1-CHI-01]|uniref:helix-turn-helix domain-containing protein n=1 Tax=Coleofasciculus sp. D1-CHI-01 TaxID=3068482 RepID=UPI0032F99819
MKIKVFMPEGNENTFQYTNNLDKRKKIHELNNFIFKTKDVRECKRAEAVKLELLGISHQEIANKLGVSMSFIAKHKKHYNEKGVDGLKLKYKGAKGYLTSTQKAEIVDWIKCTQSRNLSALKRYLKDNYNVVFKSKESYYRILRESQVCWRPANKAKR